MIKKIIVVLVFIFSGAYTFAQSRLYFNPALFVGYAFNCGFTYGLKVSFGFHQIDNNVLNHTYLAISAKYAFFDLKGQTNNYMSFNFTIENDFMSYGIGMAQVSRKSGFKRINTFRTFGPNIDISFHTFNNTYMPWLATYAFIPLINSEWFERTAVVSFYTYFRQNNILL